MTRTVPPRLRLAVAAVRRLLGVLCALLGLAAVVIDAAGWPGAGGAWSVAILVFGGWTFATAWGPLRGAWSQVLVDGALRVVTNLLGAVLCLAGLGMTLASLQQPDTGFTLALAVAVALPAAAAATFLTLARGPA
ncbi:MAG: hypothetical protein R3F59_30870 [Myxococcota bacterium]